MTDIQTYAVYTCTDSLKTDLTAQEVVQYIYRYDGADYRLEPKMITDRYDDNELPDIQDTTEDGNPVFEVWFKHRHGFPWNKSPFMAFGEDADEAEAAFLQESFDRSAWDDAKWIVLTTEQYLAERARNDAEAESAFL